MPAPPHELEQGTGMGEGLEQEESQLHVFDVLVQVRIDCVIAGCWPG